MSLGFSRILTLSAVVLATGTMTMTGSAYGEPNKVEMAAAAKVSIDEAIKTASEKVSGMVIEAELKQKQDRLIWELEVVTPEKGNHGGPHRCRNRKCDRCGRGKDEGKESEAEGNASQTAVKVYRYRLIGKIITHC